MQIKQIFVLAIATLAIIPMQAQQRKTKKGKTSKTETVKKETKLQSIDGQTFSYAFGIANADGLKQFLVKNQGVDSLYLNYAMDAMAGKLSEEQGKIATAQAAGLRIADQNKKIITNVNKVACGKEDSTYVNSETYVQALQAAVLGKPTTLTADSAKKIVEQQLKYQEQSYKEANETWLVENAKLKGVKTLPSGLQYRVLTEGTGPIATDSTEVEVHYEGSLIDGTVFDSSYKRGKPSTFKPIQVIKGWKEALTMMPEGSIWNLYIPANLGYGERGQGRNIPGNSTLIFKVEVIKVKPTVVAAKALTPAQKEETK